jgi:hypothetical protein
MDDRKQPVDGVDKPDTPHDERRGFDIDVPIEERPDPTVND